MLDSPCFLLVFLPFSFIWVLSLLKDMLEIFFIGLDNFILLRYMGWGSRRRNWKSKIWFLFFVFCFFLQSKLHWLYFSPGCIHLGFTQFDATSLGTWDLFAKNMSWLTDIYLSDPLVQWVISWKKHELLLVIIMPSPFLECLWRHKASAISVIKNSFVCNFCYCIQLIHSRESFSPNMMAFFL